MLQCFKASLFMEEASKMEAFKNWLSHFKVTCVTSDMGAWPMWGRKGVLAFKLLWNSWNKSLQDLVTIKNICNISNVFELYSEWTTLFQTVQIDHTPSKQFVSFAAKTHCLQHSLFKRWYVKYNSQCIVQNRQPPPAGNAKFCLH